MDDHYQPESAYAWWRLMASLALMTVGGAGMYAVSVVLPAVQADFGVDRADASMPYTLTMIGFGIGGILMGRLADRFGVMLPQIIGAVGLGLGFVGAGLAGSLWSFNLAQGLLLRFFFLGQAEFTLLSGQRVDSVNHFLGYHFCILLETKT